MVLHRDSTAFHLLKVVKSVNEIIVPSNSIMDHNRLLLEKESNSQKPKRKESNYSNNQIKKHSTTTVLSTGVRTCLVIVIYFIAIAPGSSIVATSRISLLLCRYVWCCGGVSKILSPTSIDSYYKLAFLEDFTKFIIHRLCKLQYPTGISTSTLILMGDADFHTNII